MTLLAAAALLQRPHTVVGDVRTHAAFESKLLGNRRDILVWLPPQYAKEPKRRFPVLYLHDGQNVFDAATSFAGEWRADEAATGLIGARRMEPIIMVAVPNMGAERGERVSGEPRPQHGRQGRPLWAVPCGGVEALHRPDLPDEDRAARHRPHRLLARRADHAAPRLTKPKVFGKLGVVSPSVWWNGREILGQIVRVPARIWLDIGTDESASAQKDAEDLRDALVAKGWREGRDLAFYLDHGAKHNEAAWSGRMGEILTFLFPAKG